MTDQDTLYQTASYASIWKQDTFRIHDDCLGDCDVMLALHGLYMDPGDLLFD